MSYYTDQRAKPVQAIIAWIVAIFTLGYMLPWAIAASRGKSNALAIGLLNFFLGWSVVGWIIALVMAVGTHQVVGVHPPQVIVNQVNGNQYGQQPPAFPQQYGATAPQVYPVRPTGPAPGWYPQADGSQRWWDGFAWAPVAAPSPPPPPISPVVPPAIAPPTVGLADTLIQPLPNSDRQQDLA